MEVLADDREYACQHFSADISGLHSELVAREEADKYLGRGRVDRSAGEYGLGGIVHLRRARRELMIEQLVFGGQYCHKPSAR